MPEKIEDITINYADDAGVLLVKELNKEILTRGSWTTIVFLYEERDPKTGSFGEPKASIRRYKKSGGEFRLQSKFNISGKKQAIQIAGVLTSWFAP